MPGVPLGETDEILTWSEDGRFAFVARYGAVPLQIDRLELSSGKREAWKTLMPEDPTAVIQISSVVIAPDGRSYVYSYVRAFIDDLYVVDGVR